eukprot:jgi/Botrbrau1/19982/Bobra.0781s0002.1
MAVEEAAIARAKAAADAAAGGLEAEPKEGSQQDDLRDRRYRYLLVEAALSMLRRLIKRAPPSWRAPEGAALLNPMLPLLARALRSRHSGVTGPALRCLASLLQFNLTGFQRVARSVGTGALEVLRKEPSTSSPVAGDALRLLAALLQRCPPTRPPRSNLRYLLSVSFQDMDAAVAVVAPFGLLREVVSRRMVLPEVFSLMYRLQELLVRSQAAPVRELCSSLLLAFILHYPVGEKRLEQKHINFLVANIGYEHDTGRLSVLQLLEVQSSFLLLFFFPVGVFSQLPILATDPKPAARPY